MQFAGGIAAAALVSGIFPNKLQAANSLSDNTTVAQGFFIEAILTGELVMTIIMLAVVKSRASFMAPLAIGLALFIGHLIGKIFCRTEKPWSFVAQWSFRRLTGIQASTTPERR